MRARLVDVAHRAGVAPTTASTILNKKSASWASQETQARVLKAAEELGYKPNRAALGLRTGRFNALGLALPDLHNPFYTAFAGAFEQIVRRQGYHVTIDHSCGDALDERRCFDAVLEHHLDGIALFVCDPEFHRPFFNRLAEKRFPVVALSHLHESPLPVDTLQADYTAGTSAALTYLLGRGHRHFGFLRQLLPAGHNDPRPAIFERLLREQGPAGVKIDLPACIPGLQNAREATNRYLRERSSERATALFAYNDLGAIGAMRGAVDAGLSIPRDLSVIGFNNVLLCEYLPVSLSTIALSVDDLAEHTARMLLQRIDEHVTTAPEHVVMQTDFVERESTAPVHAATRHRKLSA